MFGVGWGLAGFCPGPAVASLGYGLWQSVVFVSAMLIGMLLWERRDVLVPRLTGARHATDTRGAAAR